MKKKILFTISNIEARGGTERTTYIVASGLAENGFDVTLFSTKGEVKNITYDYSKKLKFSIKETSTVKIVALFEYIFFLRKTLINENIKTLVSVEAMSLLFTFPALLLTLRRKRIQYIIWEHFNATVSLGKKLRTLCRKLASKYADHIVTLTQKDIILWRRKFSDKANYISIPNASPFEITKKQYDINNKTIIAVGRLTYQKGFDRFISIVAKLRKQLEINEWEFLILGSGEDDEKLKKQIVENGLSDIMRIIGNTPYIKDYYEKAAFMCMTSRFEGLPMTLIEAQSFGLPIIAYDCLTGPSEVISKESGFSIENNNEKEFIKKIKELIQNNELRSVMSTKAKKETEKYAIDLIIKRWETLIYE